MRILIIDDERQMLRALGRILRRRHEVVECETAVHALDALREQPFDVIVCDLHLADLDGEKFLSLLPPSDQAHAILMSGGAITTSDAHALATHRALRKPFTQDELFAAVDAARAA